MQPNRDLFVQWIRSFNKNHLHNEDDVETKFVLPFFQHLGYPEDCRRGKYPIKNYNPGKQGRKPEADQVYFATSSHEEQNSNSTLVVVEAKKIGEDLEHHIEQAKFYGEYLKSIFLVITNGDRLIILKRHRFRDEEQVFDDSLEKLTDPIFAVEIFNKLNFNTVRRIKEQITNDITHARYVELDKTLQLYPDIQAILNQGDFNSHIEQQGRCLTVVEPKVAITCNLPLAFGRGTCEIKFSSITLRNLCIRLTHQEILSDLMKGLNTNPRHGTRRFIEQVNDNLFELRLSQATVLLSEQEAIDLCKCIDRICTEYKTTIIEAERILETEDCTPWHLGQDSFWGDVQFYLVSIQQKLWQLILRFINEFDFENGSSEWHIFDSTSLINLVNVSGSKSDRFPHHVYIRRFPTDSHESEKYVHLIYSLPESKLDRIEGIFKDKWENHVGLKGVWTAKFTKKWLLCELIPKVCEYYQTYEYNDLFLLRPNSFGSSIIPIEDKVKLIPIKDIANSWELRQYLDIIQVWLMHYGVKVPSKLLQSFFSVCIDFSHDLDPTRIAPKDVEYIWGKISCIDLRKNRNKFGSHNSQRQWNYSDVLDFFDEQMSVMREMEYIDSSDADLFLRAFTTILSRGHLDFTQSHLNRIKHALQPIWELCRFEERFVTPQWGWNGFFYEK